MTSPLQDKFTLTGGDSEFGSRAQNIFAGLESLEAQHVAVESSEDVRRESYALMKPDPLDDFFSTSSGFNDSSKFQIPSRPPPKRIHSSSRPGYETSPSKWKRYDLSDVSASQLTEQSNQAAAGDFLRRFHVRPHGDDDIEITDSDADHNIRHVFRKPDKKLETDDGAKWPANVTKHHEMEDAEGTDEAEDVTRTQILSFADDELNDSRQTVGSKECFRRRSVKPTSGRRVQSQIPCSDDDEEEEDVNRNVRTDHETPDDEEPLKLGENSHRTSDDESDSDHFSELAQLGSDSEQEEEVTCDTNSYPHLDSSASDTEKYAPEDVDLDSID